MNSRSAMASHAACPSLLQMVTAVDGGLCRIKLPGGRLQAGQARAVAHAVRSYASGVMEITNRANLQLRGIRPQAAEALVSALTSAGLGPLPAADEATLRSRDQRRNVMISPSAGIDPHQRLDTSELAAQLLQAMQAEPALDGLSPKFAILLDGGEQLAELAHPHDIWLSADRRRDTESPRLLLGLASAPLTARADHCPGYVESADVVSTVLALIRAFMELAPPGRMRMRDLLATDGSGVLLARAQAYGARIIAVAPAQIPSLAAPPLEASLDPLRLGLHQQYQPDLFYAGFQAPLARMDDRVLEGLAELAETYGQGQLRLTPWQGGLVPGIPSGQAAACLQGLRALGLICDPAVPLARLVACAGRSGCARSQADTKADALRLAELPLPATSIHLSGCPRSCAAAAPAGFTLIAVDADHYDLHRRAAGPPPGRCLGRYLTLQQAAELLRAGGVDSPDV